MKEEGGGLRKKVKLWRWVKKRRPSRRFLVCAYASGGGGDVYVS